MNEVLDDLFDHILGFAIWIGDTASYWSNLCYRRLYIEFDEHIYVNGETEKDINIYRDRYIDIVKYIYREREKKRKKKKRRRIDYTYTQLYTYTILLSINTYLSKTIHGSRRRENNIPAVELLHEG